jgi:hypothetical protein
MAADPLLRVFDPQTVSALSSWSVYSDWVIAALAAGVGVLTLVLCVLGLYGVIPYTVAHRTSEFGLRMALCVR